MDVTCRVPLDLYYQSVPRSDVKSRFHNQVKQLPIALEENPRPYNSRMEDLIRSTNVTNKTNHTYYGRHVRFVEAEVVRGRSGLAYDVDLKDPPKTEFLCGIYLCLMYV